MIKLLEADGWSIDRQRGSHRIFNHPTKAGIVVVAGKPGDDIKPGIWMSIQRQAGWKGSAR